MNGCAKPAGIGTDHDDDVCAHTTVHVDSIVSKIVRMRNRDDWPRETFLTWLDGEYERVGIKNDLDLAERANISHSSISGWRNGRQRPSQATLKKVAGALGRTAREVWLKAGAMGADDLGDLLPEDERAVALIRGHATLTDEAKEMLVRTFLADRQREREASERRLMETIDLLTRS